MRRNKTIQKITAVMLSVIMSVSMMPVTAMAEQLETESGMIRNEEFSFSGNDELLGSSAAAKFVLKNLASGALTSLGNYGMDKALEEMFGDETGSVILAFDEIKDEIRGLKAEIENLSAKLDLAALRNDLNSYAAFINSYVGVYEKFCISRSDYADDAEQTSIFLNNLYHAKDLNYFVDGKSVINATIALGNNLTGAFSGGYNIFGAFDKLDRFTNRWEHQGYEQRKAFRDSAVYTYAMFSSMSQLACRAVINKNSGDDAVSRNIRIEASGWLKLLQGNAVNVSEMNERCAVKEHPELRIYRDTKKGTDLYVFRKNVEASFAYTEKHPEWNTYVKNVNKLAAKEFLYPMSKTDRYNFEAGDYGYTYYSQQPSVTIYQKIYNDYKSDNGGKAADLYNIFFSENKGAFTHPSGLSGRAKFATHAYSMRREPFAPICSWIASVVTDVAQPELRHLIVAEYNRDGNITKIHGTLNEMFYSPIYYYGAVEQGKLMLPEEEPAPQPADEIRGMESCYELPHDGQVILSAEEKSGYTCQWYVNTGDGNGYQELPGETGTSYTIPELKAHMNGYRYICAFIKDTKAGGFSGIMGEAAGEFTVPADVTSGSAIVLEDEPAAEAFVYTAPVTLRLVGEGIPVPETSHEVGSAEELKAAMEKISDGDWDGHTLKLTASIRYPQPITLLNRSAVIDLNGYPLTVEPPAWSEPNVDPMGSSPQIAAVYVGHDGALTITGETVNSSRLNVSAGEGIAYGIYTTEESSAQVSSVVLSGGGTAVYASNNGHVIIRGDLTADGEQAFGAKCLDGGSIDVGGNVTVSGAYSYGAYAASFNGVISDITIGGNITAYGTNSRGACLDTEAAALTVRGSVTVHEGIAGISAGKGEVIVHGNITAPHHAVSAWDGASVQVRGNAVSGGKDAVAVYSSGARLHIGGNIISSGSGGTGISATAWEASGMAVGAQVTVVGSIRAAAPLRIGGLPAEMSEHVEYPAKQGYYTFTDGINIVWAKKPADKNSEKRKPGGDSADAGTTEIAVAETNPNLKIKAVLFVTANSGVKGLEMNSVLLSLLLDLNALETIQNQSGDYISITLAPVKGSSAMLHRCIKLTDGFLIIFSCPYE